MPDVLTEKFNRMIYALEINSYYGPVLIFFLKFCGFLIVLFSNGYWVCTRFMCTLKTMTFARGLECRLSIGHAVTVDDRASRFDWKPIR